MDFVWKVIKNKQILESQGKALSKRELGSRKSCGAGSAGASISRGAGDEAFPSQEGFPHLELLRAGFSWLLSFPQGQSQQRAAGDALGTLFSPGVLLWSTHGLGQGRGLSPPGPHLGTSAKTSQLFWCEKGVLGNEGVGTYPS